jgi:hypothetical protein
MSSPREKDKTDQDDDEVPGRLRPPRPFDTNETELTGQSIFQSTMDHESKQGGFHPPLFHGSPAQAGVCAASSDRPCPQAQTTHENRVQQ